MPRKSTDKLKGSKQIFGYFSSWSIYKRNYFPADTPLDKITHLLYAFANIEWEVKSNSGKIIVGDRFADIDCEYGNEDPDTAFKGNFYQFNIHYKTLHNYKSLISIGGLTWSNNYSDSAINPESRNLFALSVIQFVKMYKFDGADICWELPVMGGDPETKHRQEDRVNYSLLVKEIKSVFQKQGIIDGREYLLTCSVAGTVDYIDNIEPRYLAEYADFLLLMTYESREPLLSLTGFVSMLYQNPDDPLNRHLPESEINNYSIHDIVQKYLLCGVPAQKLVIGVPLFGRSYGQVENKNNGLFQKHLSLPIGLYGDAGIISYKEITGTNYQEYWDENSKSSWLFDGSVFLSYESPRSIENKCTYIIDHGLGGIMYWEFSFDSGNIRTNAAFKYLKQKK